MVAKYEIHDLQDLLPLQETWHLLEQGEEMTIFQSYEWHTLLLREWMGWKLHSIYSRIIIYVSSLQGNPVMIFPAIIYRINTKTKWFGARKGVYLMGQGSYSDYMNVICNQFSPPAFQEILQQIKLDFPGLPVVLTSIREDSSLTAFLREARVPNEIGTVSLTVRKRESLEAYQESLTKKTRANLRKALNKMEADGMDYSIEITGPIQDHSLLNELVNIHVQRILIKNTKDSGLMHILSSYVRKAYRKYRDLHNNIVAMSMSDLDCSVVILIKMKQHEEQQYHLVGYQYGLRDRHSIRLLQTCFDGTYHRYSPVFRGVYDYILSCYEDPQIQEIDFLRGDEEFKYRLGGEEIQLYDFTMEPQASYFR